MKQMAESEDLQAKIGEEITGGALVALGAAHGCELSIEDVQAGAELSDEELKRVAGGVIDQSDNPILNYETEWVTGASKLRLRRDIMRQGDSAARGETLPVICRIYADS